MAATLAAVSMTFATSAPAQAINIVYNPIACNADYFNPQYFRFTLFNLRTGQSYPICYANAGTVWDPGLYQVTSWSSGNNAGLFVYCTDTWKNNCYFKPFDKYQGDTINGQLITVLTIFV